MKKIGKVLKTAKRFLFITLVIFSLLIILLPMGAEATSWVNKDATTYINVYGVKESSSDSNAEGVDADSNNLLYEEDDVKGAEKSLARITASLAKKIYLLAEKGDIKLDIDSIVMGRVASKNTAVPKVDFLHFGMEANNPWGIIGSTIFYILRRLCVVFVMIAFAWKTVVYIKPGNTAAARNNYQDLLSYTVLFMFLVFGIPYIIDAVLYFKDIMLYYVSDKLNIVYSNIGINTTNVDSLKTEILQKYQNAKSIWYGNTNPYAGQYAQIIKGEYGDSNLQNYIVNNNITVDQYIQGLADAEYERYFKNSNSAFSNFLLNYDKAPSFLNALLLLAASTLGLYFMSYYVLIAFVETACFAFLPVCLIWGYFNRKVMRSWADTVIPCVMTQLIDFALIQIPLCISSVYLTLPNADNASVALGAVELVCFWSIPAVRQRVLKLFGYEGLQGKDSNFLALAGMAMLRTAGRGARGAVGAATGHAQKSSGGVVETASNTSSASMEMAKQKVLNDGTSSVDKMMENQNLDTKSTYKDPFDVDMHTKSFNLDSENKTDALLNESPDAYDLNRINNSDYLNDESMLKSTPEPSTVESTEFSLPEGNADIGFRETLGDIDKNRYDNLVQKEAIDERMAMNNEIIAATDYNRGSYVRDMDNLQADISGLNKRKADLQSANNQYSALDSISYEKNKEEYDRKVESINNEIKEKQMQMDKLRNAAKADHENRFLTSHKEQAELREDMYAKNYEAAGMSRESFQSAKDFVSQHKMDDIQRKNINYKNFDNPENSKLLSPEERAKYYNKRAIMQPINAAHKIATGAVKGAAMGTGAVIGAFAGAGGGASTSMGLGMVGAAAGGAIYNKSEQLATSAVGAIRTPNYDIDYSAPSQTVTPTNVANASLNRIVPAANKQADRANKVNNAKNNYAEQHNLKDHVNAATRMADNQNRRRKSG